VGNRPGRPGNSSHALEEVSDGGFGNKFTNGAARGLSFPRLAQFLTEFVEVRIRQVYPDPYIQKIGKLFPVPLTDS
jgi:hypothetical protein